MPLSKEEITQLKWVGIDPEKILGPGSNNKTFVLRPQDAAKAHALLIDKFGTAGALTAIARELGAKAKT